LPWSFRKNAAYVSSQGGAKDLAAMVESAVRTWAKSVLALVFIAAFFGFFVLTSAVGFVNSPERSIAAAKESQLREGLVTTAADYISQEMTKNRSLVPMSTDQLRGVLAGVITESWLELSIRTAHQAFSSAIHDAETSATMDTRGLKAALLTSLDALESTASSHCVALLGKEACADTRASRRMVRAFQSQVRRELRQVDDQVNLMRSLTPGSRVRVGKVQRALESMETARMLALVVLITSMALFTVLCSRPRSAMLTSSAKLLAFCCLAYLTVSELGDRYLAQELSSLVHSEMQAGAADIVARFSSALAGEVIRGSTFAVATLGVVAAVVFVLTKIIVLRVSRS